jgi:hypothetical protein
VTFAVTLQACIHVPDNTRLIATYSEEYSLADAFREIHKLACLGQFSAQTAKIDLSSLVRDLRNAAWGENLGLHFPK